MSKRKYIKRAAGYVMSKVKKKRKKKNKSESAAYISSALYYNYPMMDKTRIDDYIKNLMMTGMSYEKAKCVLYKTIPSARLVK